MTETIIRLPKLFLEINYLSPAAALLIRRYRKLKWDRQEGSNPQLFLSLYTRTVLAVTPAPPASIFSVSAHFLTTCFATLICNFKNERLLCFSVLVVFYFIAQYVFYCVNWCQLLSHSTQHQTTVPILNYMTNVLSLCVCSFSRLWRSSCTPVEATAWPPTSWVLGIATTTTSWSQNLVMSLASVCLSRFVRIVLKNTVNVNQSCWGNTYVIKQMRFKMKK